MLKEYFDFSKGERRSVITLIILILLVIAAQWIYPVFKKEKAPKNLAAFKAEIDSFRANLKDIPQKTYSYNKTDSTDKAIEYFYFNPNTISSKEWTQLGLSSKQANVITKYLKTGARFWQKEDLKKIYILSSTDYKNLEPYIVIPPIEKKDNKNIESKRTNTTDTLFAFDPNTASHEELALLGLSIKNINTINNYLKSGGSFKVKEDFKKVYGISEISYNRLAPFIVIPEQAVDSTTFEKPAYVIKQIELNAATAEHLETLYGIGPVLAKRIITFREKAGGFYSIYQLKDIYGIQAETFENIRTSLLVDTLLVNRNNLNFISKSELIGHPYISTNQAKAIIKYRNRNGNFTKVGDLIKVETLNDSIVQKISPYFYIKN